MRAEKRFLTSSLSRFVFLTDTHYWADAPRDYGAPKMLTKACRIHESIVPAVNALEPDFILPEVLEAYRARDDAGEDSRWEGQPHDCDCDILIPRLRDLR